MKTATQFYVANIIVATLKQTVKGATINLSEIGQAARTTSDMVEKVLTDLTGIDAPSSAKLRTADRFELAMKAAELGAFERAARALSWQEFEGFCEDCLAKVGFTTQKGIVFHDGMRRWQIDLVAIKSQILLTIDCKHWETSNYTSRFKKAIEHQKLSIFPLIQHLRSKNSLVSGPISSLAVIISLFEPQYELVDGVVLVSVGQLREFLDRITPYNPELPFVSA